MAPFNKRQIGYIQAIAGRQQHRTLICGQFDDYIDTSATTDFQTPRMLRAGKVHGLGLTGTHQDAKSLLLHNWTLDSDNEIGFDSRTFHNDDQLQMDDFAALQKVSGGFGHQHTLNVFDAPLKDSAVVNTAGEVLHTDNGDGIPNQYGHGHLALNEQAISSVDRASPDGFLNSTDIRFRFTLPRVVVGETQVEHNTMGQDHYEFRWIVWRAKKPTMLSQNYVATNLEAVREGCSFRNPGYDFFIGQTGRKRGLLGWTHNADLDKDFGFGKQVSPGTMGPMNISNDTEKYAGYRYDVSAGYTTSGTLDPRTLPQGEKALTVDDLLTMRINKDDYVVMKDVRFFLGKEHGKSHFEDTLHWDWNDPIDAQHANVLTSPTLNDKNYRWHMTLIGTSGGASKVGLNTCVRWTTKMESG